MKKVLYLLLCILVFPVIVNAKEDVYINKVEKDEFYGDVVEKSEPTFDGLSVNFDLRFSTVSSYATYKVTIKNDAKEEYKINQNGNGQVGYFIYTYKFADNSAIIKPGESKVLFVKVEFGENVPRDKFVNSVYTEDSEFVINFSNSLVNPETKAGIAILVMIILVLSIIAIVLLTHNKKALMGLVLVVLLVPVVVSAIKELSLSVKTRVEIDRSCNYKLVTNMGSFSNTEDVTEVCMDLDDEYSYVSRVVPTGGSLIGPGSTNFDNFDYAYLKVDNLYTYTDDDYVRVYKDETKQDLLVEVTKDMYALYPYSVGSDKQYNGVSYISRSFDKSEGYYVDKSQPGINTQIVATRDPLDTFEDNGPWIADGEDLAKFIIFSESIYSLNNDLTELCGIPPENAGFEGYMFRGFTNCRIYEEGKENVCGGHIYYANITFSCQIITR